jgi:hypothetical protein
MSQKVVSLVPFIHVKSVPRSIEFYARLGFKVGNTHQPESEPEPVWAWLYSDKAHLMVSKSGEPVDPTKQAVIFWTYTDDVSAFRKLLMESGVKCGEITYPFYNRKGEFSIEEPDGYCVMVANTGD